jgi:putative ABC transport system permease protein
VQTLRLAGRRLARVPGHTAVIIISLSLGLAVAITAFAVVNALLFGQLPGISDRQSLSRILLQHDDTFGSETIRGERRSAGPLSTEDFQLLSNHARDAVTGVSAEGRQRVIVDVADSRFPASAAFVPPGYFEVLGTQPARGRLLGAGDAMAGAAPAAIIGFHLWQARFGSREDLVGEPVYIDGHTFRVAGIAPPQFTGLQPTDIGQSPLSGVQLWLPLQHHRATAAAAWLHAFGRRAPARTSASVDAALASIDRPGATWVTTDLGLNPSERPAAAVAAVSLFMVLPLCVLLIAVANVVSLQIARAHAHQRDVAIRRALGASQAQAMRWLHAESLLLVMPATIIGLLLSRAVGQWLASLMPFAPVIDTRVVAVAVTCAALATWLSGWWPARRATLRPRNRLRHGLVAVQVAVGVALVLVAALAARSVSAVVDGAPAGSERVQFTQVSLPTDLDAGARQRVIDTLVERTSAVPEFSAVGIAATAGVDGTVRYWLDGDDRATVRHATGGLATPGWLTGIGSVVQAGRLPEPEDAGTAVVSTGLAERLSARGPVLGQRLQVQPDAASPPTTVDVVGIVADAFTQPDGQARVALYLTLPAAWPRTVTLLTRQRTDAATWRQVQSVATAIEPQVTLTPMYTLREAVSRQAGGSDLVGWTFLALGAVATLLAALGLGAITTHMVATRSTELAIRSAVGASPRRLLGLVFAQAARLTMTGAVIGLAGGVALATAMRSQLVRVSPADPIALTGTTAVLITIALAATAWPALRASRTNPASLLRSTDG